MALSLKELLELLTKDVEVDVEVDWIHVRSVAGSKRKMLEVAQEAAAKLEEALGSDTELVFLDDDQVRFRVNTDPRVLVTVKKE